MGVLRPAPETVIHPVSLCQPSMDGDETNRLFRQVVRRFDAWSRDKAKVTVDVQVETIRQILSFVRQRRPERGIVDQFVPHSLQCPAKRVLRRVLFAAMNDVKQLAEVFQQPFPIKELALAQAGSILNPLCQSVWLRPSEARPR